MIMETNFNKKKSFVILMLIVFIIGGITGFCVHKNYKKINYFGSVK